MSSSAGRLPVRNPVPGARGGGLYVSELQRSRLLEAAFAVIGEAGYRGMAVRKVAERAGVSSKTFYDLFSDREDCFIAAFDYGVQDLAWLARPAYGAQRDWVAGVRAGLGALLSVLDGEPALRRLLFVEALGVGPLMLERRAEVMVELAGVIDEGRVGVKGAEQLPPLTAEGLVGAAFSLVHARLSERDPEPLSGLLNGLMAMLVLPYRGRAAAARQLSYQISQAGQDFDTSDKAAKVARAGRTSWSPLGSAPPVDFRLTVRRQAVLATIAELGARDSTGEWGPSNREVADRVGIHDQGQISRLMMRLQEQGFVEDTHGPRQTKAWRLTPRGEELVEAYSGESGHPA